MKKMDGYKLLSAETIYELEMEVSKLISHGWSAFESPVISRTNDDNVYFYQAVVRYLE
ncbi:DUF1737 domain-containing protein [Flavobacterium suzhouense]|uniref:DUF1737 domain-containing protein n=1 Tax=Flavobacterium suzhouense TaxID=1529638 RepID=A0ABW5NZM7_9FLAO